MSDPLNEQLSALLDGELAPAETELLLKRLSRDKALRQRMSRYSLIGDAVRASAEGSRVSAGFAARISTAIEREVPEPAVAPAAAAPPLPMTTGRGARWWRSVGGFAVAATVAGLAVLVLQRPDATTPELAQAPAAPTAVVATTATSMAAPSVVSPGYTLDDIAPSYVTPQASGATASIPPAQLANYVIAHSEFGSPLVRRNVLTGLVAQDPLQEAAPTAGLSQVPAEAVVVPDSGAAGDPATP